MSAERHLQDSLAHARRHDADIDDLIEGMRVGRKVGIDDLLRLRHSSAIFRSEAILAEHDLARMPQFDRRDAVLPPTLGELLEKRA